MGELVTGAVVAVGDELFVALDVGVGDPVEVDVAVTGGLVC
ncbi:hypothetical protein [Subtercola lobariae]|nr:hypothetical protein [Subtercola lobariae]